MTLYVLHTFLRHLFFGGIGLNKKIKDSDVEKLYESLGISQDSSEQNEIRYNNFQEKDTHLSWKPLAI